jgi:acyl-[acyl-carrier-protein] desaturase
MCKIGGDEMRHHHAYSEFVNRIFQIDKAKWCLLFNTWWNKIVMPAHFLESLWWKISTAFEQFSDSAQRIGVYAVTMLKLCKINWQEIDDKIGGLTKPKSTWLFDEIPGRMAKISERLVIPQRITFSNGLSLHKYANSLTRIPNINVSFKVLQL